MGFNRSWNPTEIMARLRICAGEASSPYNDGWTAMSAKRDLVDIILVLEDLIEMCPTFSGEEEWEQERLVQLLKK